MVSDLRIAREREAMARAPRTHMETAEGPDAAAMNAEQAEYTQYLDPQWMIAYKLFTDDDGEYGIAYPVPIGQFTQGANALVNMRRRDGGFAWTSVPPPRIGAKGTIECISERCGDAHIGGKRKMLPNMDMLIKHVETFHEDDARTYRKYLDQIADQLALNNPRLMALMEQAGITPSQAVASGVEPFYCQDDECTRYFDTQSALDAHMRSHR